MANAVAYVTGASLRALVTYRNGAGRGGIPRAILGCCHALVALATHPLSRLQDKAAFRCFRDRERFAVSCTFCLCDAPLWFGVAVSLRGRVRWGGCRVRGVSLLTKRKAGRQGRYLLAAGFELTPYTPAKKVSSCRERKGGGDIYL
jgi:hypothetical protein